MAKRIAWLTQEIKYAADLRKGTDKTLQQIADALNERFGNNRTAAAVHGQLHYTGVSKGMASGPKRRLTDEQIKAVSDGAAGGLSTYAIYRSLKFRGIAVSHTAIMEMLRFGDDRLDPDAVYEWRKRYAKPNDRKPYERLKKHRAMNAEKARRIRERKKRREAQTHE